MRIAYGHVISALKQYQNYLCQQISLNKAIQIGCGVFILFNDFQYMIDSSKFHSETVPLRTVNRQCSSGLQAVADVAAYIQAGYYDIGRKERMILYSI